MQKLTLILTRLNIYFDLLKVSGKALNASTGIPLRKCYKIKSNTAALSIEELEIIKNTYPIISLSFVMSGDADILKK